MTDRNAYHRAYKRRRRLTDPAYREKTNQATREWRKRNPDYAKTKGAERRADPEKYGADKIRNREMMRAKRADPAFRARENARAKERYRRKAAAKTAGRE